MHYAEQAVESDPYNAKALVNLANCFYSKKVGRGLLAYDFCYVQLIVSFRN